MNEQTPIPPSDPRALRKPLTFEQAEGVELLPQQLRQALSNDHRAKLWFVILENLDEPGCRSLDAGRRQQSRGGNDMKAIVASALMLISTTTMANAAEKDADIGNYSADYWLPYCKDYIDGTLVNEDFHPHFCAGMVFGLGIFLRQDPKAPCTVLIYQKVFRSDKR